MDSQNIPVTISCGKCGSNALDVADQTDDSSVVTCTSCQTIVGKWGDIKVAAAEHVKEAVQKELKDGLREAFKSDKNITIK